MTAAPQLYLDTGAYLHRRNPLAKVVATAPMMLLLVATRDPWIPSAVIAAAITALAVLGRVPLRRLAAVLGGMLGLSAGFVLLYPLAASGAVTDGARPLAELGPVVVTDAGVLLGLSTALRVCALLACALLFSLTTDGADFVRALVQQWRLPYRIGYSALAAFRFVPRFQRELGVIRAAHTVRGISDRRGVRAQLDRTQRYAVPLLASGLRHAERVALAMDARGFGAHPDRTYLRRVRTAPADLGFVAAAWALSAAIVWGVRAAGLMTPLTLFGR